MPRGIMRMETFARVLQSICVNLEAVKVAVLYHGGEPLLNKNFGDMVRQIKALGVPFVKTVSNGMLLDESIANDLVSSGLDAIEFSLDGQSPKENNFIRRNCDYDTVISNIKALIACKRRLHADALQIFIASTQFLDPKSYGGHEDPKPPDYLLWEFSGEYATEITGFKSTWAIRWPHMEVLDEIFDLYQEPSDSEIRNACDNVENTVTICWNGDVVSCCYDLTSRSVLGNIHKDDLSAIWNNKRYLSLRQSIAKMKFLPLCANCAVVKPKIFLLLKPKEHGAMDNEYSLKGS